MKSNIIITLLLIGLINSYQLDFLKQNKERKLNDLPSSFKVTFYHEIRLQILSTFTRFFLRRQPEEELSNDLVTTFVQKHIKEKDIIDKDKRKKEFIYVIHDKNDNEKTQERLEDHLDIELMLLGQFQNTIIDIVIDPDLKPELVKEAVKEDLENADSKDDVEKSKDNSKKMKEKNKGSDSKLKKEELIITLSNGIVESKMKLFYANHINKAIKSFIQLNVWKFLEKTRQIIFDMKDFSNDVKLLLEVHFNSYKKVLENQSGNTLSKEDLEEIVEENKEDKSENDEDKDTVIYDIKVKGDGFEKELDEKDTKIIKEILEMKKLSYNINDSYLYILDPRKKNMEPLYMYLMLGERENSDKEKGAENNDNKGGSDEKSGSKEDQSQDQDQNKSKSKSNSQEDQEDQEEVVGGSGDRLLEKENGKKESVYEKKDIPDRKIIIVIKSSYFSFEYEFNILTKRFLLKNIERIFRNIKNELITKLVELELDDPNPNSFNELDVDKLDQNDDEKKNFNIYNNQIYNDYNVKLFKEVKKSSSNVEMIFNFNYNKNKEKEVETLEPVSGNQITEKQIESNASKGFTISKIYPKSSQYNTYLFFESYMSFIKNINYYILPSEKNEKNEKEFVENNTKFKKMVNPFLLGENNIDDIDPNTETAKMTHEQKVEVKNIKLIGKKNNNFVVLDYEYDKDGTNTDEDKLLKYYIDSMPDEKDNQEVAIKTPDQLNDEENNGRQNNGSQDDGSEENNESKNKRSEDDRNEENNESQDNGIQDDKGSQDVKGSQDNEKQVVI